MPLWRAAAQYRESGSSVVIVAGERYGMGSSRDWAAKGVALLGTRAVLAASFERIHRSNLVNMGILPLRLPEGHTSDTLRLVPGDLLRIDAAQETIAARAPLSVSILRRDGASESFQVVVALETSLEVDVLRTGGLLPMILSRFQPNPPA
jgi:aconitate hydratase